MSKTQPTPVAKNATPRPSVRTKLTIGNAFFVTGHGWVGQ